jgi:hypothetical protein
MKGMTPTQAMLGTWGELWLDDEYMAEVKKFRAEVTINYDDVKSARKLMTGKKITGLEGTGEVGLAKVSSFCMKKISDALKAGKTPSFKIVSKLKDPDAIGAERVVCYGCKFEKATLADWEVGSIGEESYSFTFEDWELLDVAL